MSKQMKIEGNFNHKSQTFEFKLSGGEPPYTLSLPVGDNLQMSPPTIRASRCIIRKPGQPINGKIEDYLRPDQLAIVRTLVEFQGKANVEIPVVIDRSGEGEPSELFYYIVSATRADD